ncbi:MAG: hypothetical protein AB7E29_08385 [Xanthobacter sp.]
MNMQIVAIEPSLRGRHPRVTFIPPGEPVLTTAEEWRDQFRAMVKAGFTVDEMDSFVEWISSSNEDADSLIEGYQLWIASDWDETNHRRVFMLDSHQVREHIIAAMDLLEALDKYIVYATQDDNPEQYFQFTKPAQDRLEAMLSVPDALLGLTMKKGLQAVEFLQQAKRQADQEFSETSNGLVIESLVDAITVHLMTVSSDPSDQELERIFASPKVSAELDALIPH